MTLARRVAALEAARTPAETVLAWLDEAHRFPTLTAYALWLVEQPEAAWPLVSIPAQLEAGIRKQNGRRHGPELAAAMQSAVRDAVLLVELVLRMNLSAEEILRIERMRLALLQRAAPARASARPGTTGAHESGAAWRRDLLGVVATLDVEYRARAALQQRYFRGQAVLFPAIASEWAIVETQATGTAGLASPGRRRQVCIPEVGKRIAELIESANAGAFALLGDVAASTELTRRRLQASL